MDDRGWVRLGRMVRAERVRLGYRDLASFADRTGVARRTLSDLERGARERFRPETLAAVESVLGWAPGSIARTVQGGRPGREPDADLAAVHTAWPRLDARGRRLVRVVAENLAQE